jgi:trans-2,3-dihydro-3-hydroxyanthranilate isomerase
MDTGKGSAFSYRVVDVFTQSALEGNALAVFLHAWELDTATMQRVARELNLAETVFVLPTRHSDCVARVRIFTPVKEMAFAGHPTIGTAYVLDDVGMVRTDQAQFHLEEGIGPVSVRVQRGTAPMYWLKTPPIKFLRTLDRALCARVLGLRKPDLLDVPPQLLSAGNPTILIALRDKKAVDRAWLDPSGMKKLRGSDPEPMCVFIFAVTNEGAYSRMFAPDYGIAEDPATGSSTGPLAAFMMQHGLAAHGDGSRFTSEQGTKMGRRSLIHVQINGEHGSESIEIGGHVTPLIHGVMSIGC